MTRPDMTRRDLLRILGTLGNALVAVSLTATTPRELAALVAGKSVLQRVTSVTALKTGVNGPFPFPVNIKSGLNTNEIYLIKDAHGTVTALEATCRHMGCAVFWAKSLKAFECPCHGSSFTITGAVQVGPAKANLYHHSVRIKRGKVWVMTGRGT